MRAKQGGATTAPRLRFPEFSKQPGFQATTVGQLASNVCAGGTPDTNEKSYWGGDIWWMNSGELNLKRVYEVQGRITEEGLKNSSTKQVPAQSVLIGLAGQGRTRGTVAMNMVPLCINQSIAAIYPGEGAFVSDFLYHNLDGRYEELRGLSAGGEGRGGLNLQIIRSLEVLVPNLEEQQKIADCLTSLDEVIAAQGRKVEALKAHKRGLMQQLFPREGETRPRLRFPEFQDTQAWKSYALIGLADTAVKWSFAGGPFGSNLKASDYTSRGVRIIQLQNIGDGEFLNGYKIYTSTSKADELLSSNIYAGEVLLSKMGDPVGRACIVPESEGRHVMCSDGIRLVVDGRNFSRDFTVFAINFDVFRRRVDAASTGSTRKRIGLDTLKKIPLDAPKLAEQQKIADCLSSLDTQITAESNQLAALKAHKQGLMQQLFPAPDAATA